MRAARLAVIPAGLALGLFAEWAALRRGPFEEALSAHDLRLAAGDLIVGVALASCGAIAWWRRPESRVGALLAAAGGAWFLGTFSDSGTAAFADFGAVFVTLHRGPLVHAVLSYPSGRLSRPLDRVTVVAAYLDGAVAAVGLNEFATLGLCALIVVTAARQYLGAMGPERRARTPALASATGIAGALAFAAASELAAAGTSVGLWAYQVVLFVVAVGLLADLLFGRWAQAAVTGLVVDLGEARDRGTLRDRLAYALGDPSLVVGYWLPEQGRYVDDRGEAVVLPEAGSGREVTRVDADAEPVAVLVHDVTAVNDPELLHSVASAAHIAVSNARLQADVRRQVEELEASRRRIVEAGDAQRRRLERELSTGAERRLARVRELLEATPVGVGGTGGFEAMLAETSAELDRAQSELREFAGGIHPRALTEGGLPAGLADLVASASVPIELHAPAERFAPAVEAAAYFVSSEALANIGKYAEASRATIAVASEDGRMTVEIADDGVGGASLDGGSGLRGLADRVEALGGRLSVESPPGSGTRLRAELPLS